MKLKLLSAAIIASLQTAYVHATPSDLFFSEYVEGSSNNKALEIANLTEQPIQLNDYQIKMYFNGKNTASLTINLSGEVAAGETFVIAHEKATSEILSVADQTQGSGWFNGDDAIELVKSEQVVDSIGQIGFDPGSEWGIGDTSTQNNTLRRTLTLDSGDINSTDEFDPAAQWQGYTIDTFDGLGKLENSEEPQIGNCNDPAIFIHQIQGTQLATTMGGAAVEVEGIVIADFQNNNQLNGFFIQEELVDQDSDEKTSEGIFIYDSGFGVDVSTGDKVRVSGIVDEYGKLTQIKNIASISICESGLNFSSKIVSLPLAHTTDIEKYEGMSIKFEQTLTVSENYNLGRYGELLLSYGRLFNPTNQVSPGESANIMQAQNNLNRIVLDDGSSRQNPTLIPYPQPELSAYNTVRAGDTVQNIQGVLHEAFGAYRIQPTTQPIFQASNLRPDNSSIKDAPIKVASFNVLNYFNGDGLGGGFPTERGANTYVEFMRQQTKIVNALADMQADVIGLMEIENDGFGSESAIADLVNALSNATGKNYTFAQPIESQIGTDAIAVGLIYNTEKVVALGHAATLSSGVFSDKNRQPLLQTFREIESNGVFSVVVNHFKSKGSCPSNTQDSNADQNDGQGCWNEIRTQAAVTLVEWLQSNPTQAEDNDIMIIGDLNAYAMEDPITQIESLGFNNLLKQFVGEDNYSYVFYGQAGSLDHALSNSSLTSQVTDVTEWHINADEPKVLDYNLEYKTDEQVISLYSEQAYRASDHDPVIVGLYLKPSFDTNNDGKLNAKDIRLVAKNLFRSAAGNKRRYDFNQDGRISLIDLFMLLKKIKQS